MSRYWQRAEEIEREGYFRAVEGRALRDVFVEALPLLPTACKTSARLLPSISGAATARNRSNYSRSDHPLQAPDLASARTLARGHTRSGRAVLFTLSTPLDVAQAQILEANLSEIGLGLEIKEFPSPLLFERLETLGEPFDIGRVGWVPTSSDPRFLNGLLDGRTIGERDFTNWSRFDSPKYNRLLDAASRLPAGPEATGRTGSST